ncbi:hypothetical protein F3Y22_tig00116937pilonHSYRG00044 [Hibiscus syriacus]|uniref:FLZ-type domain-containing protein n=1 Tax=Hibiscus syriacus TaxID=106335 RepID=A0A6A2WMP0_HIBSY|nr:hypothetical protein F3Y22_tig00116937pilonHSYRG00044 [Hibiscus syriacus]
MLLGKRTRQPIKRTTSMTGIAFVDASDVEEVVDRHPIVSDPPPPHLEFDDGNSRSDQRFSSTGDTAFCSLECREKQMNKEEREEKNAIADAHQTALSQYFKTQLEALHKLLGTPTASGSLAIQGGSGADTPSLSPYPPNIFKSTTRPPPMMGKFFRSTREQESEKMIGTAKVDDGLYVWNKDNSQEGMALSTSKEDSIMLWHRRLGHPNFFSPTTTKPAENPTAIVILALDPVFPISTMQQQETRLPETETTVPMPSLPEDCLGEEVSPPSPSIYLPTALRKGTRSCTQHPISQFVSYGNLSKSYNAFVSNVDSVETPKNIEEALKSTKWRQVVLDEIKALEDNGTWEISKLPTRKKIVGLAKLNTIRVLLLITVNLEWPLIQLNVKNAFLNGELNEEVYMDFPPEFEGSKGQVCKLKKSLYGLKQFPRAWFNRFAKAMTSRHYIQDDIILTVDYSIEIERLKEFLSLEFQLKDLRNLRYFLGMEIARSKAGIPISQRKYVLDLLPEVGLLGCKPAETPMEPNLKLGIDKDGKEVQGKISTVSGKTYLSFSHSSRHSFWRTPGKGLHFKKDVNRSIEVYIDADWAGVVNDRRSTSRYCSYVWGNLVTWSKKQSVMARNNVESEYRALSHAVSMAHNLVHHDRTKHVEIDHHFIMEKINKGENLVRGLASKVEGHGIISRHILRAANWEADELAKAGIG